MDIAMMNAWIYFKMANSEEANMDASCADFFMKIASDRHSPTRKRS
jgi:hypothetical protein